MSKKAKIIAGSVTGGVIVVAGIVVLLIFLVFIPAGQRAVLDAKYNEAIQLMENGPYDDLYLNYDDAMKIFIEIHNDSYDVKDDIIECHYLMGVDALNDGNGRLTYAIQHFTEVGNYKDAPELLKEAYYQDGWYQLESKEYNNAHDSFEQVAKYNYKNSKEAMNKASEMSSMYMYTVYRPHDCGPYDAAVAELPKYIKENKQ